MKSFGSMLARIWFPIALVFLLVLSLPGVVFFILHQFTKYGNDANNWLQKNFNLTYHYPFQSMIPGILLLLLPFLIVLLYFLKLKRQQLQVPSTFLWKKSIEDLHVNSLFQWLRRNVLLLLQLLVLLFVVYSVMNFRIYANISAGKHYIIMIDNSASMSATDLDGQTRLDRAKEEAIKEISATTKADMGMVIVFNSEATTLMSYTNNRSKLISAVKSIRQTNRPTDIVDALKLADGRANPRESVQDVAIRPEEETLKDQAQRQYVAPEGVATEVYLYSDGRFPELSESVLEKFNSRLMGNTEALGNINLKFRAIGLPGSSNTDNIGIVGFRAVKLENKKKPVLIGDKMDVQVDIDINNYRSTPVPKQKVYLDVIISGQEEWPEQNTIYLPAREYKESKEGKAEDIPGYGRVQFILKRLPINADILLRARLKDTDDKFKTDDEAWLAITRTKKTKVLRVGPANRMLDSFFFAQEAIAETDHIPAKDMEGAKYAEAMAGEYDFVLFDRCAPAKETDMPRANTMFIDQPPPPWNKGKKEVDTPNMIITELNHPFLRWIFSLNEHTVTKVFDFDVLENIPEENRNDYTTDINDKDKVQLPQVTHLIENEDKVGVAIVIERGPFKDLLLPFAIQDDKGGLERWCLNPSFFLFMKNVLYEQGNVKDSVRGSTTTPGNPIEFQPGAKIKELIIETPSKVVDELTRDEGLGFVYGNTDELGIYTATPKKGKSRELRTVSLLDSLESNLQPRESFKVGDRPIFSGQERPQSFSIWKWVLLGALVLLLLEWYIYNRRVYI